ncbi:hypothetical protein [Granulicatella sp.]
MSNLQKRLLKLFFIERLKVMGFSFLFFSGIVVIFSLIPRMETFVYEFEGSTLLTFAMIFSIFLKCIPQFQLSTMAGLTRTKIIMNELLLNIINVLVTVIIFLIASALNINWTIGSVHIYFSVEMLQFGLNSLTGMLAIFLSLFASFMGATTFFFVMNKFASKKVFVFVIFLMYPIVGVLVMIVTSIPNLLNFLIASYNFYIQNLFIGNVILCGVMTVLFLLAIYKHESKSTVSDV